MLIVQWLVGWGTARSAELVHSRHPGRYPKLKSSTLSYPAFEPLMSVTGSGVFFGQTNFQLKHL